MKTHKRWLSLLLSVVIALSYMPALAYADDEAVQEDSEQVNEQLLEEAEEATEQAEQTEQSVQAEQLESEDVLTVDPEAQQPDGTNETPVFDVPEEKAEDIQLRTGPSGTVNEEDWSYIPEGDHAIVTLYTGNATNVTIPDTINGLPVTIVKGEESNSYEVLHGNTTVTEIAIPSSVTEIYSKAFNNCNLRTIRLDCNLDTDKFDYSGFIPDSVYNLILGEDVITLPYFYYRDSFRWIDGKNLQKYVVDEDNSYYIAVDGVLFNHDMTKLIRFPRGNTAGAYSIPDGVKEIGDYAFSEAAYLAELHIPDSVVTFGENALGSRDDNVQAGKNKLIVYASEGSAAEAYAVDEEMQLGEIKNETQEKKDNATRNVTSSGSSSLWNGTSSEEPKQVGNDYYIKSAAQLSWLSEQVAAGKKFKGCNFLLTASIDLKSKIWTPIGTKEHPFEGNFDGQNHTISNLCLEGDEEYGGLFGYVKTERHSKLTIKNIKIKNVKKLTEGGNITGALIGQVSNTRGSTINISGCYVTGTLHGSAIGGAIGCVWGGHGNSKLTVKNVKVQHMTLKITYGVSHYAGGVVGLVDVQDHDYEGGFNGKVTIVDCNFNGSISKTARYWGIAGGIAGGTSSSGSADQILIKHCKVEGSITGGQPSGGIINSIPNGMKVQSCVSYASVYGYNSGCIAAENSGVVEECYTEGESTADIGGNSGGMIGVNNGRIINSYNGGTAPNRSDVTYNGNIAASGSGVVENTYNVGDVAKEISSSTAWSSPGVFGWHSGQTLIHSYYDNTLMDYIFGDVKLSNVIDDPDLNIIGSGGMSTIAMKSADNYVDWDFDNVWMFDVDYSWGYPTLRSIKDLLKKHPDTAVKNKLRKTQFKFNVVDQAAEPVEDAKIVLLEGTDGETKITTDNLGNADTQWRDGTLGIKITKEGYIPYEDPDFAMNARKEITLMIVDSSKIDAYPLKSAIMEQEVVNGSDTSHLRYELLTQTKTINREWSSDIPLIPNTTYKPFTIKALYADPARTYKKAELIQGEKDPKVIAIASNSQKPEFTSLEYKDFQVTKVGTFVGSFANSDKYNEIFIRLTEDKNGQEVVTTQKINLVVDDKKTQDFEIEFCDDLTITVPSTVPFPFGGNKITIPMCKFPVTTKVNADSLEIGLNLSSEPRAWEAGKGFAKEAKTASQKKKDKYDASLPGSIAKLKKYMRKPGLAAEENGWGPVKMQLNFVGYGKTDLPIDGKFELQAYLELEVSLKGETQVYMFVVAADGSATGKGGGVIALDFNNSKVLDQINSKAYVGVAIAAGVHLGVGVANAASFGIYGAPIVGVEWIVAGGDHRGLDTITMDGTLSFVLRFLGSNAFEYPVITGSSTIYSWSDQNDPSSQGTRSAEPLMKVLKSAPQEQVVEPNEASAGEWTGASDVLQEKAYSSSVPVILNVDGDRVMVFCSNTDTERAALDRSILMYSVYDKENSSWGEPQPVNNDRSADFNVSGTGKYIVWNNAKGSLSGAQTYNDLGKNTEICVAEYDSSTHSFKNIKTITDNNDYENRLSISGANSPVITWTIDESGNILGVGGDNTYYTATMSNGDWNVSRYSTVTSIVAGTVSGVMDGKNTVFYILDEDGDLATYADNYLYADDGSGEPKKVSETAVSQLAFSDETGQLLFTDIEGDLYSVDSLNNSPQQLTDDGRLDGTAIVQIISDQSGNMSLILTKGNGVGRDAYVMCYNAALSKWGGLVRLTDQTDYVEGVSAYYEGDDLVITYNQRRVTLPTDDTPYSEANSLHWTKTNISKANLSISDVHYYIDDVHKGTDLPLSIYVNNTGFKSLDNIGVRITADGDGGTITYTDTVADVDVSSGGTSEVETVLPIPEDAELRSYKVTVFDPDDSDTYAEATITVGEPNYKIEKEAYSIGGHDLITATVTNEGFVAGSGEIEFYDEYDPDTVFDSYAFVDLEPDEVVNYTFKPEEKGLKYDSLRVGIRIVDSVGDTISDSRQVQIWKNVDVPVSGVMLTENYAELTGAGDSLKLEAAVKPASAAENAVLKWSSSNPDYISVDQNGLVTCVKPGKATITVFSEDEKYYDECVVYGGTVDINECTVKRMKTRYKVSDYGSVDVIEPSFTVVSGNEKLIAGVDYDYEYTNNAEIGDAHLILTGKGHFTGTLDKVFKIKRSSAYDKPDVTGFTLTEHELTLILGTEDSHNHLHWKVYPEDAGDKEVIVTSSDESVAKAISYSNAGYGWVEAVGAGTCTLTARTRDGSFTDTCEVTVKEKTLVNGIEVLPSESVVKMAPDEDKYFLVNVLPEDAYDKSVSVEVKNEDILSGYVISNKEDIICLDAEDKTGETTVTVRSIDNNEVYKTFKVIVTNEEQGVRFQREADNIYVGDDSTQLYIESNDGDYFYYDSENVTMTSSDESVLKVDNDGFVNALKPGKVVVTAKGTYKGKAFTTKCYIKVVYNEEPIRKVYISKKDYDSRTFVGDKVQLIIYTEPEVPRSKEMIWSSDNESIATVDNNGLVTCLAPGVVNIKAVAVDPDPEYGEVSNTYQMNIEEYVPLTGLVLADDEIDVPVETEMPLDITFVPENATVKEIEWKSEDEDIAFVMGEDGEYCVSGWDVGQTTITGTTKEGLTVTLKVNVFCKGYLRDAEMTLSQTDYTYDGKPHTPKVTVKYNGEYLVEGEDFETDYWDSYGPGTSYVGVYGINGYTDYITLEYTITDNRKALSASNVTVSNVLYTGKACTPAPVVKYGGKTLVKGTDYTITGYSNNVNEGTAKVTIQGIGNYKGTVTKTFSIYKLALGTSNVTVANLTYNGKARKPLPVVKYSGKTLVKGTDYYISSYSNNTKVGSASVTIVGKGKYKGTVKKYFRINPSGTTLYTPVALKKGFTAKWKKQAVQTTGYQLQYATNSKFTTGVKTLMITKNTILSKKVTLLTAKKKYYMRIRTYKTVSGVKYYSAWSTYKTVTTKK